MKGLELSKKYYEEYGRAMILETAPQLADRFAAGLAGDGSQCFGFDDEISRDHDFAPGFCIWLADEDFALFKKMIENNLKVFYGHNKRGEDYICIITPEKRL